MRLPRSGATAPQLVRALPRTGSRIPRRPKHTWLTRLRPFQIQPVAIAPVLAGDSFKGASFEFRTISNALKNTVTGWWCEFFLFYISMSDLDTFGEVQKLMAGQAFTLDTAASAVHYNSAGHVNWSKMCLDRVTREYFRAEADIATAYELDGLPVAGLAGTTWVDTLADATTIGSPADDYSGRFAAFEALRQRGLITMSYREFLEMEGVDVGPQLVEEVGQKRRPELLRYTREFVYPSLTTDPITGEPAAMVQWLNKNSADKARFFPEPGFIFAVMVCRPKMYRGGQRTSGASVLNSQRPWMAFHGSSEDAPQERLLRFNGATAAINVGAGTGWADIGALFTQGDQFVNFDPASPPATWGANVIAQPSAANNARYITNGTAIDGLFTNGANNRLWSDGILSLRLTSVVPDTILS